ncbi:MAG: hypothetical protein R3A10_16875 [Caldilineaceae bacterium]
MKSRTRVTVSNILIAGLIIIALIWVLFPFYWAFLNSIKKPSDTFTSTWIPFLQFQPTLDHWRAELDTPEIRRAAQQHAHLRGRGDARLALGHPGRLCAGTLPLQSPGKQHLDHMVSFAARLAAGRGQ